MAELQRQSPAWTRQTKKGGVLPGFSCRERKNGEGLRALAKFRCLCSRRLRYPLRVCACRQYGEFDRPNGEVRALLVLGNQCLEPRQLLGVRVGKVAVLSEQLVHLLSGAGDVPPSGFRTSFLAEVLFPWGLVLFYDAHQAHGVAAEFAFRAEHRADRNVVVDH